MEIKIELNGKDVTKDVSPYRRGMTYTDNITDETDDLTVELSDVKHLFLGDWFPDLGMTLSATLSTEKLQLPLGTFEIDEVDYSLSPSIIRVKSNSVPQNSALRQVNQSKSWENVKLSEIAKDIASSAQVELIYQTAYDPAIERAEQGEKSALNFLENLCTKNYLILKFSDGKLIIFDAAELEKAATIMDFDRLVTKPAIKSFRGRRTLSDVYKECELNYKSGSKSETFSAKFTAPNKTEGKTLKINRKVSSQAEAERVAKNELKQKNKDEWHVTLEIPGDIVLVAGLTVGLKNFGKFDGNWLIERVEHTINGGGFETRLELRRCLEGYE